ncbi:MAG: sensor histidine kinase [Clostridium sp.]
MKIIDYFKDKGVFFSVNIIAYIILGGVMILSKVSIIFIFTVGCIWFIPLISYMIGDYIRFRKYFNEVYGVLSTLDKKYLLPEVIEESSFLVGENINDILRVLSRDMHENVKKYRELQEEYREYIETWVHEIKTPIASSKLLVENNKNEVTKKIDAQLDRVENYVEQVLYYSRSDEVGNDYVIKEMNIGEVVRAVIKRNYRDFIGRAVKIELNGIDSSVFCDPKWIEFIVNEIVVNAVKYCESGRGIVKVSLESYKNSEVLIIEDNGVGISDKDIGRVFDKGFTGENGRIFGKSTGIGLYLCKKLCNKLGIGIKVEGFKDRGTKVSIIFPNGKLIK